MEGMKNKLRVSFSLLSTWMRGEQQASIDLYLHKDREVTPAMAEGRKIHKEIEDHIKKTSTFPDWLFKGTLVHPKSEHKLYAPYNELFDLSAVFDCLDEPTLYEFKTGVSDSLDWIGNGQLGFYFLICEINHIPVEKGVLIHWDQKAKANDWAMVWNSQRLRSQARNLIDSIAPDIWAFFDSTGVLSLRKAGEDK